MTEIDEEKVTVEEEENKAEKDKGKGDKRGKKKDKKKDKRKGKKKKVISAKYREPVASKHRKRRGQND